MYYVYILYSPSSDKYYVGSSEAPLERCYYHNTQEKATYTSKHRPWVLKAVFEAGATRSEAFRLEQLIKKQKSRTLIERLLQHDYVPSGALAQLVRVPHVRD